MTEHAQGRKRLLHCDQFFDDGLERIVLTHFHRQPYVVVFELVQGRDLSSLSSQVLVVKIHTLHRMA